MLDPAASRHASLTVSRADARRAAGDAHRLFQRTLSGWTSDLLVLQRRGRSRPAWRNVRLAAPDIRAA